MKHLKTALLASAFVMPSALFAAPVDSPLNTTADVTIVGAITIDENENLTFGRVVRPATGDGYIEIATNGAVIPSGGLVYLGDAVRGQYDIHGENNAAFTLVVTPGACDSNLVLSNMDDTAPANLNGTGDAPDVFVVGKLKVPFDAATGLKHCDYTVAANY